MQTRISLLLFYALLHQRLMETDKEMKILNKSEKKVYNELLNMIQFENIDCNNIPIPKGWLNNINGLKINEDLK